ncbi:MAG: MetQ/NlpA family ABC transporter substrate-binding protein [Sarcina sp.]
MKKKEFLKLLTVGVLIFGLIGCTENSKKQELKGQDDKNIVIGVSPVPHKGIVEVAKEELENKGYNVEIKEFTDYVIPNTALDKGDLDANFFQHTPYLNDFNEKNKTKIKGIANIHLEPLGGYSKKIDDIKDLKEGSTIALPNDPSNEARALKLLADNGLIKIKNGETITVKDITENLKNFKFKELEAALLTNVINDVDLAIINGNYALELFNPAKDALILENKDSAASKTYANILAVNEGDEDKQKIKDLKEALTSENIKTYIEKTYIDSSVIPVF